MADMHIRQASRVHIHTPIGLASQTGYILHGASKDIMPKVEHLIRETKKSTKVKTNFSSKTIDIHDGMTNLSNQSRGCVPISLSISSI